MPPKANVTPALVPSTAVSDLDAAIRSLELSTNPSLRPASSCDCNATRHPLLTAAPNCLSCGKIICVKHGLGACSFCHAPLLSPQDLQSMIRALKDERGREKMEADKASHRRPDVSKTPRPFTAASKPGSLSAAEQHRNKLLSYQASSAQRTQIIDEAADFETPSSGQSMWSSPHERALQLKRQQKALREQQWAAKPEYEKRRAVVSIDLVGGKVVKRMGKVERPVSDDEDVPGPSTVPPREREGGGAFSNNPLLGALIRPVYTAQPQDTSSAPPRGRQEKAKLWRRVQDDADDNEALILDGGIYGQPETEMP
ncbi:MAG: hypothetical protein M1832_002744 [Thelocarpon impressellum]|nr:MAG: hypothetical protein M1832_002744 [Thelocarpon impressellum]